MMKEKSQVMDIDRSIYDIKDVENDAYRIKSGLTPEIIEKISKEKKRPCMDAAVQIAVFADL